jgi:hypothetical protein
MASDPAAASGEIRAAGQYVDVIDHRHKLYGKCGRVVFFVGDNIYVKFSANRWAPTRMFFPEQLKLSGAPNPKRRFAAVTALIRKVQLSLPHKMRT